MSLNKGSATIALLAIVGIIALGSYLASNDSKTTPEPDIALGAPYFQQFRDIIPDADSTRYVGTSSPTTIAWASGIFDELCLTADSCKTAWPTAGSGSFPFSADTNFAQVVYSTSTPTLWFKSGVFASSTSRFVHASTTSFNATLASTTYASTTAVTAATASTTNLIISGSTGGILKTSSTGVVSIATLGTDYQTFAYPWGLKTVFATGTAATSTSISTGGVFFASSTVAASQFPYASTTAITATTASTTNLVVSGLNAANCDVKSSTSGVFSCGTDSTGSGGGGVGWATSTPNNEWIYSYATYVGIGTTTPRYNLQLASTTAPQLALSDGSGTSNHWTLRSGSNNLFFATGSPTTFATSTTPALTINGSGYLGVGTSSPGYPFTVNAGSNTTPGMFLSNIDNFAQIFVWNKNSGTTASTDIVVGNDKSCPEAACGYYVDLGINSSNYSNATYSASGPNDSYLYANDDNLVIGTASTTDLTASLIFTSGGFTTSHERMRLTRGGLFGFGTTTPVLSSLTIASTTAPQLSLSAGAGIAQWTMRNAGGKLYLSTTTVAGTATSTPAGITIDGNAGTSGLYVGTSTPGATGLAVVGTSFLHSLTQATGGSNNDLCISGTPNELIEETTGVCVVSMRASKHNILDLDAGLETLLKLKPVSYSPNQDEESDYNDTLYGFVAEDLADADPHLARYGVDGKPRTIDDWAILSVITKAVQEIWHTITNHESRLEKLEKENAELRARLEAAGI